LGGLPFALAVKRIRIAVGAIAAIFTFLGLWLAEIIVIVMSIDSEPLGWEFEKQEASSQLIGRQRR
jgi:hypothetical protein